MFPQTTTFGDVQRMMLEDQMKQMMLSTCLKGGMGQMAMPRMDVYQRVEDGAMVCWVELPGMKKENVDVCVVDDRLVITGRKPRHLHECSHDEDEKMVQLCTERAYGAFMREVKVARGTEEKDVKANMDNGLLKVVVCGPKEHHCHHSIKVE